MEITLRLIEPKPKYKLENEFKFYEYSDYLGWVNKPYANGTFYMPDSKSYVRINSNGLRDYEHSYNKKINTTRIEFIGDSFTWGYGVNEEKRFTNVFASQLDKNSSNQFEIINMGTSGYETDQEYLLLKSEGIKYNPDIVVVVYHNDATFLGMKEAYGYPRPYFTIENNKLKLMNVHVPKRNVSWEQRYYFKDNNAFWKNVLKLNSLLANLKIYVFFRDGLLKINFIYEKILGNHQDNNLKKKLEIIDILILESEKLTKNNNAKFVIILIPDKKQVYQTKIVTEEIDHLVEFGRKNNITVINLLSDLREIGIKDKELYFVIDGHLSVHGNRIVGELIANKFIENKIIKI